MAKRRRRDDDMPNEREAISMGLALAGAEWNGDSDFDRGMRLLQERMFGKKARCRERDMVPGDDRTERILSPMQEGDSK